MMLRTDVLKTAPVSLREGPRIEESQSPELVLAPLKLFSAVTGSTYRSSDTHHYPSQTESTTAFQSALSPEGLPMSALFQDYDPKWDFPNKLIQATATHIMALLDRLSQELQGTAWSEEQVKARLQELYQQLDFQLQDQTRPVVFSASLVYKNREGELKALSFSQGNMLLALAERGKWEIVNAARYYIPSKGFKPLPPVFPTLGLPTSAPALPIEMDLRTVNPGKRFIFMTDDINRTREEAVNEEKLTYPAYSRRTLKNQWAPGNLLALARQIDTEDAAFFNEYSKRHRLASGGELAFAEVIVPTPEQQMLLQQVAYDKALEKLNATLEQQDAAIRDQFTPVKNTIMALRARPAPDLPALTKALLRTDYVIQNRRDERIVNDYVSYAQREISSSSSFLWKVLGRAMQVAAAVLALLGGLVIAGTLGGGAAVGAPLLAGGVGLAGLGEGLYRKGKNALNLQGDMVNGGEALKRLRLS